MQRDADTELLGVSLQERTLRSDKRPASTCNCFCCLLVRIIGINVAAVSVDGLEMEWEDATEDTYPMEEERLAF